LGQDWDFTCVLYASRRPLSQAGAALAGVNVLVVDDNELNCKLMARLLQGCGASGMCLWRSDHASPVFSYGASLPLQ
jgi:hypothetical protein